MSLHMHAVSHVGHERLLLLNKKIFRGGGALFTCVKEHHLQSHHQKKKDPALVWLMHACEKRSDCSRQQNIHWTKAAVWEEPRHFWWEYSAVLSPVKRMYQSHVAPSRSVMNGLLTRRGGGGWGNIDDCDSRYFKKRLFVPPAATSSSELVLKTLQLIYSVFSQVEAKLVYGGVTRKSASLSLSKYSSSFA